MVRLDTQLDKDAHAYEAQRQANIKANLELMMSLGIGNGAGALLKPKSSPAATTKARAKKAVSPDEEYSHVGGVVQRPRRITRSVSRTLDSPKKVRGRGMKRALSDDVSLTARKVSRVEDDYDADAFDASDDDSPRRSAGSSGALNPARFYRPVSTLQRHADRLGIRTHSPKTFGAIPSIPIGTTWAKRIDCSTDAVHAPTVAGISGNEHDGCWSICLSGGYEDDVDLGESFTYTGSGGRDLKGTKANPKNLRTAPQSADQTWEGKNAALRRSVQTRKPVRVVRGWKAANRYAPSEGYVYSGLYRVEKAWMERGASGWMVCKFRFVRLSGQDPLPTFDHDDDEEDDGTPANSRPEPSTSTSGNAIDLTHSPSPSPSLTLPPHSPSRVSPHPILSGSTFDRTSYIIISDDEADESEVEQHTLMQLEVEPPSEDKLVERVARGVRRTRSLGGGSKTVGYGRGRGGK